MALFKKDKTTKKISAPEVQTETTESVVRSADNHGSAFRVFVSPILSEKTARSEARGTYTFAVAMNATKTEIARAMETVYGVRPTQIRTSVVEGKKARFGQNNGRRSSWKKAVVTLPKGKTISIHTGV